MSELHFTVNLDTEMQALCSGDILLQHECPFWRSITYTMGSCKANDDAPCPQFSRTDGLFDYAKIPDDCPLRKGRIIVSGKNSRGER